jgi:hypothetical protein
MAKRKPQPGFTLTVTWFEPERDAWSWVPVRDHATLHRLLAPYQQHQRLAVTLRRDEGETGEVLLHLTGDRAWVTHFTQPGGVDSYCRDNAYHGDELLGFLLSNGQLDQIHRYWTVTRADGLRALDYFLQTGERDPNLSWKQDPGSLQKRPEQGQANRPRDKRSH